MKKILVCVGIIIGCFILTACDLESVEDTTTTTTTTTVTTTKQDEYMDALRKCTVMEGADIYNSGRLKANENAFDKATEQCELWYDDWGEEDFFEAVKIDWENRKNEEIEGKPLTYYLDVLGW